MAIIKCPSCGSECSSFAKKCGQCGAEFKSCPHCGNLSTGQQSFCSNCGRPFSDAAAPPPQSNPQPTETAAATAYSTGSSSNTVSLSVKGKKFAIAAFVLAMVAIACIFASFFYQFALEAAQDMAHDMTTSTTYYYVANVEEVEMIITGFLVLSIITAVVSDIMVIFGYVGHAQNVKRGVSAKKVLVFSIIATVVANIAAIIALSLLS